jgi:hypothetical protein
MNSCGSEQLSFSNVAVRAEAYLRLAMLPYSYIAHVLLRTLTSSPGESPLIKFEVRCHGDESRPMTPTASEAAVLERRLAPPSMPASGREPPDR